MPRPDLTEWHTGTGLILSKTQFPCRTLVACPKRSQASPRGCCVPKSHRERCLKADVRVTALCTGRTMGGGLEDVWSWGGGGCDPPVEMALAVSGGRAASSHTRNAVTRTNFHATQHPCHSDQEEPDDDDDDDDDDDGLEDATGAPVGRSSSSEILHTTTALHAAWVRTP